MDNCRPKVHLMNNERKRDNNKLKESYTFSGISWQEQCTQSTLCLFSFQAVAKRHSKVITILDEQKKKFYIFIELPKQQSVRPTAMYTEIFLHLLNTMYMAIGLRLKLKKI